jgi:hypothetical protein
MIKVKNVQCFVLNAEKAFLATEPDFITKYIQKIQQLAIWRVATKAKPRWFGVLKELFVQWCLDFCGILDT